MTFKGGKEICNKRFPMNKERTFPHEIPSKDIIYPPTYLSLTPLRIVRDYEQLMEPTFKKDTTNPRILPKISLKS